MSCSARKKSNGKSEVIRNVSKIDKLWENPIGMIFQQMIDSMAYINTKIIVKTGKSMDKEIILKYLWI